MPHTYVLGLGNVLMGDDGFGPAAVRAFAERCTTGPEVEVVDLGTPGLDLTPWFTDAIHVVIVDTVKADLPAGSLKIYTKDDLTRNVPFSRVSPHDPGVKETVLTLEFAGRAPEQITVVGVVPEHVGMGLSLSAPVAAAMPEVLAAIADALERSGCRVSARAVPAGADVPWWRLPHVDAAVACR